MSDSLHPANNKWYFFERFDGTIISANARDAWGLYSNPPKGLIVRPKPKLIGTSDGTIMEKAKREAETLAREGKKEEARVRFLKGMEDEIEEAKKHPEIPPNHDYMDRSGNQLDITKLR